MPSSRARRTAPNVVPPESAERIRHIVFENRGRAVISPVDTVAVLIAAGHGAQFDERVRPARLLTWVKQVLRRLMKKGWLARSSDAEWMPTAVLRTCRDALSLNGGAPLRRLPPARASGTPDVPARHPEPGVVESWPEFVAAWVHSHLDAPFNLGDLVADMIRNGFGSGEPSARLEAARKVAREKLEEMDLALDGLEPEKNPLAEKRDRGRSTRPPPEPVRLSDAGERSADPDHVVRATTPPLSSAAAEVDDGPATIENPSAPVTSRKRRRPAMDADLDALLATFRTKHAAAVKEADFYARMIREIEGMLGSAPPADEPVFEAAEKPARKRRSRPSRKPKGGMTITEAVHKVIADAGQPLTPAEIVPEAARLAGAKEISIRTSITPLARKGLLTKVEHEGRGFRYGLPEGA